jgi:hypothetical protein
MGASGREARARAMGILWQILSCVLAVFPGELQLVGTLMVKNAIMLIISRDGCTLIA